MKRLLAFKSHHDKLSGKQDFNAADCVIGLSFGYQLDQSGSIQPGLVNARLAAYIAGKFGDKHCILQHEIADALEKSHSSTPALTIRSRSHEYLDTRQVLLQAKDYMSEHNLQVAIIVAQSRHIPRIKALCKRLGISAVFPPDLPNAWDSRSAQWWIRASGFWNLREPAVMLHHKLMRWI